MWIYVYITRKVERVTVDVEMQVKSQRATVFERGEEREA